MGGNIIGISKIKAQARRPDLQCHVPLPLQFCRTPCRRTACIPCTGGIARSPPPVSGVQIRSVAARPLHDPASAATVRRALFRKVVRLQVVMGQFWLTPFCKAPTPDTAAPGGKHAHFMAPPARPTHRARAASAAAGGGRVTGSARWWTGRGGTGRFVVHRRIATRRNERAMARPVAEGLTLRTLQRTIRG